MTTERLRDDCQTIGPLTAGYCHQSVHTSQQMHVGPVSLVHFAVGHSVWSNSAKAKNTRLASAISKAGELKKLSKYNLKLWLLDMHRANRITMLPLVPTFVTSAEEGGYVFGAVCLSVCLSVCLFVCLSVCPSDYSQTCERILTKFFGAIRITLRIRESKV